MRHERGQRWPLFLTLGLATVAGALLVWRQWLDVVVVEGRSMAPTLLPGDRLLVESLTYRNRPPRVGEVVLAPDPRVAERELIKRVHAAGDELELRGDRPSQSTDSRTFGMVSSSNVRWRAVLRYWPPDRAALIRPSVNQRS
jgi:nickel-type superoxide dismutase maturation protease